MTENHTVFTIGSLPLVGKDDFYSSGNKRIFDKVGLSEHCQSEQLNMFINPVDSNKILVRVYILVHDYMSEWHNA